MYQLIVSPFLDSHVVLRQGDPALLLISRERYDELATAHETTAPLPQWLVDQAAEQWSLELRGRADAELCLRPRVEHQYARASYEINLDCNFSCQHCYHGGGHARGLNWEDRLRVLQTLHDAGVLWLQLSGGEPTIDPLFPDTYAHAWDAGMVMSVLTNGSMLSNRRILDVFTARPAHQISVSVYGARESSYEAVTRSRGSFKRFLRGVEAGVEAGLPLRLHIVPTSMTDSEESAMEALAARFGLPLRVYGTMIPTFGGASIPLTLQAETALRERPPWSPCHAGHEFFNVGANGEVTMCKGARTAPHSIVTHGDAALLRMAEEADLAKRRTGACADCLVQEQCVTCAPLVALYRAATAPPGMFCVHALPQPSSVLAPQGARAQRSIGPSDASTKVASSVVAPTTSVPDLVSGWSEERDVLALPSPSPLFEPFRCTWL